MEALLKAWTADLARATEGAAALIIGFAVLRASWRAFLLFVRGAAEGDIEDVRLQLGRWLTVALEFALAADILGTAIAPSWDEIGKLAAIVVLRTALNYFLQQEIDRAAKRQGDSAFSLTSRNDSSVPSGERAVDSNIKKGE